MAQAKWKQYSKEELQKIANDCKSYRDFAIKLGYSPNGGGSINSVKQAIKEMNLDISHFTGQGWNKDNFDYNRFQYGKIIKVANALPAITALRGHKCEMCGQEKWFGEIIPLEIHHIDGDRLNNVLDNLQLLCPNCHALTENWRGKNISKKKETVDEETFVKALEESNSVRQALIKVGLTPKGGNYDRAYNLIGKHNIVKFQKQGD